MSPVFAGMNFCRTGSCEMFSFPLPVVRRKTSPPGLSLSVILVRNLCFALRFHPLAGVGHSAPRFHFFVWLRLKPFLNAAPCFWVGILPQPSSVINNTYFPTFFRVFLFSRLWFLNIVKALPSDTLNLLFALGSPLLNFIQILTGITWAGVLTMGGIT